MTQLSLLAGWTIRILLFTGEDTDACFHCIGKEEYDGLNILLTVPHDGHYLPLDIISRRGRGCCTECKSPSDCFYNQTCDSTAAEEADK